MRRSMVFLGCVLSFLGIDRAFGQRADLAAIRAAGRMVCVWKPGDADKVLDSIKAVNLKVLRRSEYRPAAVCVWDGELTAEQIKQLESNPSLLRVSPDERVYASQPKPGEDEPMDMLDAATAEVLAAEQIVCHWKPGQNNKDEFVKFIDDKVKGLKIRRISENSPTLSCVWNGQPSKNAIRTLQEHPYLDFISVDTLQAVKPLPGREPFQPPAQNGKGSCEPNDPEFKKLYGMQNCRATQAWCCFQVSDVIVAVVDSGVDYDHPDLKDNIWRNPKEIPGNGKDDDGNKIVDDVFGADYVDPDPTTRYASGDPKDEHFHGTHVAGTIGAIGNNGEGVAGVCWRVPIMVLRVLDKDGNGWASDTADAILYAAKNGAKVVNLSLGQKPGTKENLDVKAAVAEAAKAGVLCVFAAGNESNNNDLLPTPHSSYPDANIIAVANITETEALSGSSNFGATSVDLAAPGDNIRSTTPTYETDKMREYTITKEYAFLSGTSMASPHVAGTIALIWGQDKYKAFPANEIKALVLKNARRLNSLTGKCVTGGALDIGFLCPVKEPPPTVGPCPPRIIYRCPCINYCPQYPRRCYRPCWRILRLFR